MANPWREMTEDQLIEEANAGMRGSGAMIEMLRRMQNKAIVRLSFVVAVLTLIIPAISLYLQWRGSILMVAWWPVMRAAAHSLQIAGLVVAFAGALLLAISQQAGTITHGTPRGEAPYIILARPRWWRVGLYLLCAGFVIQLIGEVLPR